MQILGAYPQVSLGKFTGTDDTLRLMREHALGKEGEQNFRVRQWTEAIVRQVAPKDYLGEILAIRAWATSPVLRYTNDQRHTELVKTPFRIITEIEQQGSSLVDCDDIATVIACMGMQLGREASFCVVGFGAPGAYTHVFARIREPKSNKWIVCDPVAGPNELQMLRRVGDNFKIVGLD